MSNFPNEEKAKITDLWAQMKQELENWPESMRCGNREA